MNTKFHEGEYHIQEIMGVREESDTLSSMIRNTIPQIAADFLKNLNFCIIVISTKRDDLFTSVVYNTKNFIEIINQSEILIKLQNNSHIPKKFFNYPSLNIGMIGLDFENALRIRINGKGQIKEDRLLISIDEIYSNCPKYIKKRILRKELNILGKQILQIEKELSLETIKKISNTDTFFISSSHKEKGLDVSHKGGKKGFLKILSVNQLQYEDKPGNNLYNSIGNIYTNPNINLFFIDFEERDTYHILASAKIEERELKGKKRLFVTINCKEITINRNSFGLNYILN